MSGTTPNIVLDSGKYMITLADDGTVEKILRYGEEWPASNDLKHTKIFTSLIYAYIKLRDRTVCENCCPGHIAADADKKICRHCGTHIDSLRLDERTSDG